MTRHNTNGALDIARLRAGAQKVGEALARARGLDPHGWRYTVPVWYGVLPSELAELFATDDSLWDAIAEREGVAREDLDVDLFKIVDVLDRRLS